MSGRIFPGDTQSRHELERRLRSVQHDLREEIDRSDRLEKTIKTRSELVRSYLAEQKEKAKARAYTLFHRNPSAGLDE
ncbi:hypothetical protein QBC45DRAFT_301332, partial [Copromyces sp. CBS 386.78]